MVQPRPHQRDHERLVVIARAEIGMDDRPHAAFGEEAYVIREIRVEQRLSPVKQVNFFNKRQLVDNKVKCL